MMSYEEKIKIYQSMIRNLEKELKNYEGTPYFEDEEFKIRERINMHKEVLRLYSQAAKAAEYEAKAKAYNDTLETLDKLIDNDERYKEARSNDFVAGMLLAYENIFYLMEDYIKESGGYDA